MVNTFDTSFGVRFGMLICFDVFQYYPATAVREGSSATDFVMSTYWVNGMLAAPPVSSTQVQQAASRALGSNWLASNIGFGSTSSGSGVYSLGVALATTLNEEQYGGASALLVADVPMLQPPWWWLSPLWLPDKQRG